VRRAVRVPIRSEREAFWLVVAAVVVVVATRLIGWLAEPVIGAVVFALAVAPLGLT
jgi:hypothetical protein